MGTPTGLSVMHPTLYTPATQQLKKLLKLVNAGEPGVWRLVICTEDSIRADEVPTAIDNLRAMLRSMDAAAGVTTYVRVRNPDVLARVLALPNVDKLRGFVVPKADPTSLPQYADQLKGTDFRLMPILESSYMVDRAFREVLRAAFLDPAYHGMIDCLRIGANDLMGYLGIRRDTREFTVYDTPVGITINEIINEFRGIGGFTITAPVFESFGSDRDPLLHKEISRHILNGLFGQTVIHPRHIRIIRDRYKVSKSDFESAEGILNAGASAVAGLNGRMDEVTTHYKWAQIIVERRRLFGDGDNT